MNKLNLDSILDIVNTEKEKLGLENYAPLYPMFRVDNNNLYIAVMISDVEADIWNINSNVRPEYWCLIDINTLKIIEFNKLEDKDYSSTNFQSNRSRNKFDELSEYEKLKKEEYEKYFMNDILNTELPIQVELFKVLNNEVYINDETINLNDYLKKNVEDIIKIKAKELVDILIQSKYGLITLCYDNLFNKIIDAYKDKNIIDYEKLDVCVRVMENYYCGVMEIDSFFNLIEK